MQYTHASIKEVYGVLLPDLSNSLNRILSGWTGSKGRRLVRFLLEKFVVIGCIEMRVLFLQPRRLSGILPIVV